jgi:hypothetical protein
MHQGEESGQSSCKMDDLWLSPVNNCSERHLGQSIYEKEMLAILHAVDFAPLTLKSMVLSKFHSSPIAGHPSSTKTYEQVKHSFLGDGVK